MLSMAGASAHAATFVEKPAGRLGPEHFRLTQAPPRAEGRRGAAARPLYLARRREPRLDAGRDVSFRRRGGHGDGGRRVAEVIESRADGFAAGDLVFADTGWQDYAALPARQLIKLPKITPLTHCSASTASPA